MSTDATLELNVTEATEQLAAAEEEVLKIRARIVAVQSQGSQVEAATRELADRLMAGDDVSTIAMPRLTGTQVRHAVQALEGALAEAQSKVAQAKGALRRAKMARLKQLLAEAQTRFDQVANQLCQAYCDVNAVAERITAATGVDPRSSSWHNVTLPRAVHVKVPLFFDGSLLAARGADITQRHGPAAAARLREVLKAEGIDE